MKKDRPSPFAHVADNDLAVGEFVEYLSKSPIWKGTAIFILEDMPKMARIMSMNTAAPSTSQAAS